MRLTLVAAAFSGGRSSILFTGAQTGPLDLVAQGLILVVLVWYFRSVRRLARRGRRWPRPRAAAYVGGLVSLWIAVGSGLAVRDESSVTLHMVQHVLLMMVAPPLLVLGRPVLLLIQTSQRRTQVRVARLLRTPAVRVPTNPVLAWLLYLAVMYVAVLNQRGYDYLIAHPLVHDASHVLLLVVGLLYWEPLLGGGLTGRRLSFPARVMSVLANMPFEVLVGIGLRYRVRPIDAINTLADTQTAGEALIVGATVVSTVWLVCIVVQWAALAVREERRQTSRDGPAVWTVP